MKGSRSRNKDYLNTNIGNDSRQEVDKFNYLDPKKLSIKN